MLANTKVALKTVPPELHFCTPLTLKATAGLRMLPDGQGEAILEAVRAKLSKYPFQLIENGGVEIMGGDKEGVYAWITLNYLLGKIGQKERMETVGIMDLGGG